MTPRGRIKLRLNYREALVLLAEILSLETVDIASGIRAFLYRGHPSGNGGRLQLATLASGARLDPAVRLRDAGLDRAAGQRFEVDGPDLPVDGPMDLRLRRERDQRMRLLR